MGDKAGPEFLKCGDAQVTGECKVCRQLVCGQLMLAWCRRGSERVIVLAVGNDEGAHPIFVMADHRVAYAGEIPVL